MRLDSWCFCNGGGKSERLKAAIFSGKSAAMAKLSGCTGFLIHRNLLLTTHGNLPSVNAAESAQIQLHNGVPATLVPHRFFITSSVLDLTIVGLDTIEGDSVSPGHHQPQYLKLCSKPNLELGNIVYLLGHPEKKDLSIGEGKVVIATDNLIKLSTEGFTWSPGSAGFDSQGNLAFMVCDPMKLATSPNPKSTTTTSSSSSGSWKKDHLPMQFGIPLPVIFDWLNQHWEGSLDDISKPKLPLMRLVSVGQRSEHSCASFSMRQVFKATEEITSSPNTVSKPREDPGQGSSGSAKETSEDDKGISPSHHKQGIPAPEIYESPKVTASPVKKKETTQIPLLDINFPPKVSKPLENCVNESHSESSLKDAKRPKKREAEDNGQAESTGSVGDGDGHSEVSSSSPVGVSEVRDDHSSEGETLYSAETAESRNYTSPREAPRFQPVGRSQSCVSYNNRWGPVHKRSPGTRRSSLENQRSFTMQPRKTHSLGQGQGGAPAHKTMDYFSPTVSSIMKKRNGMMEQQITRPKPRPTLAVHSPSPRWNF